VESIRGEGQQVRALEASRCNDDPASFPCCSTVRRTMVMIRDRALRARSREWPVVLLLPPGKATTTTMMTKGRATPPPPGTHARSRRAVPFLLLVLVLVLSLPLPLPLSQLATAMTMSHAWPHARTASRQARRPVLRERLPAKFESDEFLLSVRPANSGPWRRPAAAAGGSSTASSGPEPPPLGRREATGFTTGEELPAEDNRDPVRVGDFFLPGD
jgi:hypothetical protein